MYTREANQQNIDLDEVRALYRLAHGREPSAEFFDNLRREYGLPFPDQPEKICVQMLPPPTALESKRAA